MALTSFLRLDDNHIASRADQLFTDSNLKVLTRFLLCPAKPDRLDGAFVIDVDPVVQQELDQFIQPSTRPRIRSPQLLPRGHSRRKE